VKQKHFCNEGLKSHTRLQVKGSEAQILVNLGRSRTSDSNLRQTNPLEYVNIGGTGTHQCSLVYTLNWKQLHNCSSFNCFGLLATVKLFVPWNLATRTLHLDKPKIRVCPF